MKKFTKKQLNKLKSSADKIQPDEIRDIDLEGTTPNDAKFYDSINKLYKKWCSKDIGFIFTFTLPESEKTITFFRISPPEDREKYHRFVNKLNWKTYQFLCWAGYIKALEGGGFLKILPKGEHKTWEEVNNFNKKP